jgi:hypothetical protein
MPDSARRLLMASRSNTSVTRIFRARDGRRNKALLPRRAFNSFLIARSQTGDDAPGRTGRAPPTINDFHRMWCWDADRDRP